MKTVDPKTLVVAMTKQEKLTRWADLVRNYKDCLLLVHQLEYWNPDQLGATAYTIGTAFEVAADDAVFKEHGLKDRSPKSVMGFFELTMPETHAFTCNCGGGISNQEQADRIDALARGEPIHHAHPPMQGLMQQAMASTPAVRSFFGLRFR